MKNQKNSAGFSLLEITISIGLLLLLSGLSAYLISRMSADQKKLAEKAELTSTIGLTQQLILKSSNCDCQIKGKTFNSNQPNAIIELNSIKSDCSPSATDLLKTAAVVSPSGDLVQRIYIDGISATGNSNEYNARLNIEPLTQPNQLQTNIIPLILRFHTNPASPASAKSIMGCGPPHLTIPLNFQAVGDDMSCRLSWDLSSGAKPIRYFPRYSTTSGQAASGIPACSPYSSTSSCVVTGLTNGTIYYFVIKAENDYETTEYSTEVSCRPVRIPDPPTNIVFTPADSKCVANWTPSANGTPTITYNIFKANIAGESSTANGVKTCSTPSQTCTISGLVNGNTYYFSLNASNYGGTGNFSSPELSCKPIGPPPAPTPVTATAGNQSCDLTWVPVSVSDPNVTYTAYQSTTSGGSQSGAIATGCKDVVYTGTSCTVTGLTNGQTYYYSIKAKNASGSTFTTEVNCQPASNPPPADQWICCTVGTDCDMCKSSTIGVCNPNSIAINGQSCSTPAESCQIDFDPSSSCKWRVCTCGSTPLPPDPPDPNP